MKQPQIHKDTALGRGLQAFFQQLEEELQPQYPVDIYLAGGMAVHLYTADRVTTDIDAEFGSRIFIPNDLVTEVKLEDGTTSILYLDTNYSPTFALMHEDYQEDALTIDLGTGRFRIHILCPVDLAVSKIARLADNDLQDIASLVRLRLTSSIEIERRANEALAGFVGGESMLRLNIKDAVTLAQQIEIKDKACNDQEMSP